MNEKIIQEIKANMAVEGLSLEAEDISLISSFLNNEITEAQGIEIIKSKFVQNSEDFSKN